MKKQKLHDHFKRCKKLLDKIEDPFKIKILINVDIEETYVHTC